MNSHKPLLALAVVAVAALAPSATHGQIPFTDFVWTGNTNSNWQQDGNWDMADFPNAGDHTANVTVGTDLTIDVGATDVTIAALTLDGTTFDTDINISSSGGRLIGDKHAATPGRDRLAGALRRRPHLRFV